jgi:serine/threonine-protein phosphatase 4 regulatory subunit 1
MSTLIPQLDVAVADSQSAVRSATAAALSTMASVLVEGIDGTRVTGEQVSGCLRKHLFPIARELAVDRVSHVRSAAHSAVLAMVRVHPEAATAGREEFVGFVRMLAHDGDEEVHRVEACEVIGAGAEIVGNPCAAEDLVGLAEELAEDAVFRVRKAIAAALGPLAAVVGGTPGEGETSVERLWVLFSRLAGDEIWGVRQAAASSLVALASVLAFPPTKAVAPWLAFSSDVSRWVRSAAYASLGRFIALWHRPDDDDGKDKGGGEGEQEEEEVPSALVDAYCGMTRKKLKKSVDADISHRAAAAFPAVLTVLGPSGWARLEKVYRALCSENWTVRRSLAHSLHAVAGIVAGSVVREVLVPLFVEFADEIDEVKVGVVASAAAFVAACDDAHTRSDLLPTVLEMFASDVWRMRESAAAQANALSQCYPPSVVGDLIVPALAACVRDPVHAVRVAAIHQLALMAASLRLRSVEGGSVDGGGSGDGDAADTRRAILDLVAALARDESYHIRALFVAFIGDAAPPECSEVFESLVTLAGDRVVNVRLAVTRVLVAMAGEARADPRVGGLLRALREDTDRSVVALAQSARLDHASGPADPDDDGGEAAGA